MPPSNQLSSDLLDQQFGETKLTVIQQTDNQRLIANVTAQGQLVELSQSFFVTASELPPEILPAHQEMLAGKSMGLAFRDKGLRFERQELARWKIAPPPALSAAFGQTGPLTIMRVSVLVSNDVYYASILEIYSPVVKIPEQALTSLPVPNQEILDIVAKISQPRT